jgi:hypothetical protein
MPIINLLIQAAALLPLAAAPYPFAVGETLRYQARYGSFPVGEATMAVSALARERGAETFVLRLAGDGGPPGPGGHYELTSWVGTARFSSRRFHRSLPGKPEERYQIVPDSLRYRLEGTRQAFVTPADPLDELAFLYYLRTIPLEPGRTYGLRRYFKSGFNPVTVRVSGRETVQLGDGRQVTCLALTAEFARTTAAVWLTDDARRLPVQVRIPLKMGAVTLLLTGLPAGR